MILVCPVSFKWFLLTLMAGATVMAQQPSTSPSTSAMPSTSAAPSYSPSTSHSPSYSPSMSPSNAPSQTCMVSYANGTTYTAADFASMKSGATFDAATSTLTCSDGSLVGRNTYVGSCVGIEVENCKELDCEHEFSCYNVTTTNVPTVKCDGSGACRQAKIQSPTFLECEGGFACALAMVSLPNSAKMDCTDGGCIWTDVNPTGTGEGILVTCKGVSPSCTGSGINVGKGRIQCTATAPVTSLYVCTLAHYRADCLQCEDIRSCGGRCMLQTATQNLSCASPEPNTYGTCDNVPTESPTLSSAPSPSAPSPSAAPTGEASCKVTTSSGSVFSAQRFAEVYSGVTYSSPSGVETLICSQTISNTVSCNNITVTGCGVLECNGKRTCLGVKTMDVDEVDCEGEEACKDAQISSPEYVFCEGGNSCAGASVSDVKKLVDCRALSSISSSISPCSGMNVKSSRKNATLDCDGHTACDSNLNADLSQGNVICTGVSVNPIISAAACQDANISAVCLECRGNDGTGCGSGCEFTTADGTSSSSCASSTFAQFGSCPSRTSGASIRKAIGALTGSIALILSLMFL